MKKVIVGLLLLYGFNISALTLTSTDFKDQEKIPSLYTCDSKDISPQLQWQDPPQGTKSFALIMHDPDAPQGWDHWLIFNIPSNTTELSANLQTLPKGAQTGKNSWKRNQYNGPCPPGGEHHYIFKLYALNSYLNLTTDIARTQLEKAMETHILGTAELTGKYERK